MSTTWNTAFENEVSIGTLVTGLPSVINDKASAIRERFQHEHYMDLTVGDATLDGWHLAGSAVSYRGPTAPTKRPDHATTLSAADTGRLWMKYTGTTPYSTGNITILAGSPKTVTGSGTAWATNVAAGNILTVSGQDYVVLSVDSDTQLTLRDAGPAVASSSYSVCISFTGMSLFVWTGAAWVDSLFSGLPVGSIIAYDGATWTDNSTIPGWYACIPANSTQGCPDLTARFIMGQPTTGFTKGVDYGATGGANTHTIAAAELPVHTHTFSASTGATSVPHTHNVSVINGAGSSGPSPSVSLGNAQTQPTSGDSGTSHSHSVSGTTGNGGFANTAIDVRPQWYSVVWIRKCA